MLQDTAYNYQDLVSSNLSLNLRWDIACQNVPAV